MRNVTIILIILLLSVLFFVSCKNNMVDESITDNNKDIPENDDTETKKEEPESESQTEEDTTTDNTHELTEKKDIYFGYYRMSIEDYQVERTKGHLNVFLATPNLTNPEETAKLIESVGKEGGKVWLYVWQVVVASHSPFRFFDNWQERLNDMMSYFDERGVLPHILGFYLDEPFLCGFTKEDYVALTQYLHESWPEHRMLSIFAVNAVEPEVWSSGNDCVLDPETAMYTTDAGFDMYWDVRDGGIAHYEKVVASLKKRFGRDDFNVWYVPCTMNYFGNKDEDYALAHTEAMYDFLKREKNPGGILCYAYDILNHDGEIGNIGFHEMRDNAQNPWDRLENRLVEIGREILGE